MLEGNTSTTVSDTDESLHPWGVHGKRKYLVIVALFHFLARCSSGQAKWALALTLDALGLVHEHGKACPHGTAAEAGVVDEGIRGKMDMYKRTWNEGLTLETLMSKTRLIRALSINLMSWVLQAPRPSMF